MTEEYSDQFENKIPDIFKRPKWSTICDKFVYGIDVIKNGTQVDHIELNDKPFYIIGRQKECDFVFEHPSLSRYHAIIIYCGTENELKIEIGWYIYDLGSTHGTVVNKKPLKAREYVRLRTGHVIKFAGSSRIYVVTGPEDDKEEVSQYTWTELQEMKKMRQEALKAPKPSEAEQVMCSWGIKDIDDNTTVNKDKITDEERYKHEKKYRDDPKKVLKWWFEQEGLLEGPQYRYVKEAKHKAICTLELPVYDEMGDAIIAEVPGGESKKELITRCAYEACRILDEMGELYKEGSTTQIIKKDKDYYEERDYYSSEDDEFFDRTGNIEKKRIKRMQKFGVYKEENKEKAKETEVKSVSAKDTNNALVKLKRLDEINDEILELEDKLEQARKEYEMANDETNSNVPTELDEIERYMHAIQSGTLDSKSRMKLRAKIFELQKEENILRKQLKLKIPVTSAMRQTFKNCKQNTETSEVSESAQITDKNDVKKRPVKIPAMQLPIRNTRYPTAFSHAKKKDNDEIEEEEEDEDNEEKEVSPSKIKKLELTPPSSPKQSPPVMPVTAMEQDDDEPANEKVKRKQNKKKVVGPQKAKFAIVVEEDGDNCDDTVSTWVPPEGQTGDGRTSLNDELGY